MLEATEAELTAINKTVKILEVRQLPCSVDDQHYKLVTDIVNNEQKCFQNLGLLCLYLNMYCWNCFEYHLLSYIIKTNQHTQVLLPKLERFERDILEFRQTTHISELMDSRCPSVRMELNMIPPHFDRVTMEYDINPNEHKLAELDSFRTDVAFSMSLPAQCAIQIIMISRRQGRTVVDWIIPSELLEDMTSFLCSDFGQTTLAKYNVRDVEIDGRPPLERQAVSNIVNIPGMHKNVESTVVSAAGI